MMLKTCVSSICSLAMLCGVSAADPLPQGFAKAPGDLEPGSGKGRGDDVIYLPDIRFPLEKAPAYLNSQVYRPGGKLWGGGEQCDKMNYSYPWRDNFCESRKWEVQYCPDGTGHQGQDIRPSTCDKDIHWAVAADRGVVAQVGRFSVTLQAPNGVIYRYMHLNMGQLAVRAGDRVLKGDKIGKVSNYFGSTPTTIHLHFDVKGVVATGSGKDVSYLPPYASLVAAYKRLVERERQ
jgi:murein DD-endopeptidase MepM/ murein hydrolase activator NlpD